MPSTAWLARANNWFSWAKSGGGFFAVGGDFGNIPNYNYQFDPNYSFAGALTTLSEGQSYGLLYALLADDLPTFFTVFNKTVARHRLTLANLASSKAAQGTNWSSEWLQFMDNLGNAPFDTGATTSDIMGWVASNDYSAAAGNQGGLSSIFPATDGDVVLAGCALLAWERWGIPDFRNYALLNIKDLVKYCTRSASGRWALGMGNYRGGGGFEAPLLQDINFNAGTIYPATDSIITATAGMVTGMRCRFYNPGGATMPGGITAEDGAGLVWPAYFVRVVDPFNLELFPTSADAVANTNRVDITSVGSGTATLVPYPFASGTFAVNPSYLFPQFFALFARYDTANAAVWNSINTNVYSDITYSQTSLSPWNMPTYLLAVDKATGVKSPWGFTGNASEHQLDSVRVSINMALTDDTGALDTLKNIAVFNGVSGLWEPKAGLAGGIWRYWVDNNRIPDTMFTAQGGQGLASTTVDVATDEFVFPLGATNPNLQTGDPVTLTTSGSLPAGLALVTTYWVRHVTFGRYSLHTSEANARANTGRVDITSQGSGTHTIASTAPVVSYFYRSATSLYQTYSPYGVAQVLAYEYALNGVARADVVWAAAPAYIKEQVSGAFVDSDTDYYRQHCLGVIAYVIGGANNRLKLNGGYYSSTQANCRALSLSLGAAYGGLLTDGTNWLLRIKPTVWDSLSAPQKSATIKALPSSAYRVVI